MNDLDKAETIRTRAKSVVATGLSTHRHVVCTISGNDRDLGRILDVSSDMLDLFWEPLALLPLWTAAIPISTKSSFCKLRNQMAVTF